MHNQWTWPKTLTIMTQKVYFRGSITCCFRITSMRGFSRIIHRGYEFGALCGASGVTNEAAVIVLLELNASILSLWEEGNDCAWAFLVAWIFLISNIEFQRFCQKNTAAEANQLMEQNLASLRRTCKVSTLGHAPTFDFILESWRAD